ncbi:unnamed protein product [Prunus armeniaca]|uniref:DUF7788 domain-containing protein n=1 Tax=Prunus armeniaca TaxID=36596 RepID=A0A6J5UUW6_PRUAR|nr:unnamed protein product [Prunus armeniaca]
MIAVLGRLSMRPYRECFKDIGYEDDAVPHILFWDISNWNSPSFDLPLIDSPRPGLTLLRGWSNNLVKSFLDNGGDFRPHHLMEAAVAVVD